jgi:hypothetical protein
MEIFTPIFIGCQKGDETSKIMERKTDIHQFTFIATSQQSDKLQKFASLKGEALFDAKFKFLEDIEGSLYQKVSIKISNCGKNLAARRLAEFILNALNEEQPKF